MTEPKTPREDKQKEDGPPAPPVSAVPSGVSLSWVMPGDRKVSKKDFSDNGIDHAAVEWTKDNNHTALVSEQVAEFLLTVETGFELTDKLRKAKLAELGVTLNDGSLPAGGGAGSGEGGGTTSGTGSTGGTV